MNSAATAVFWFGLPASLAVLLLPGAWLGVEFPHFSCMYDIHTVIWVGLKMDTSNSSGLAPFAPPNWHNWGLLPHPLDPFNKYQLKSLLQ